MPSATEDVTVAPKPKPRLRGVSHEIAFYLALVAGAVLVFLAPTGRRVPAAIYVATLAAQFGISALYHRPTWAPGPRKRLRRFDHATIFLLIAGSVTPVAWILPPGPRHGLLALFWIGAAVGVLRAVFWIDAPKWLVSVIAAALGWGIAPFLPALGHALDPLTVWLAIGGGLLYTMGAAAYALRRPDPWPRVFGYHEIFHAFTILATLCHYTAIARALGVFARDAHPMLS